MKELEGDELDFVSYDFCSLDELMASFLAVKADLSKPHIGDNRAALKEERLAIALNIAEEITCRLSYRVEHLRSGLQYAISDVNNGYMEEDEYSIMYSQFIRLSKAQEALKDI